MQFSDSIDKLAPALLAAQRAMIPPHKSAINPHFKSAYAPLDAVMDAALLACNPNGLTILQSVSEADDSGFTMNTTLLHESGQWVRGGIRIAVGKLDPQGYMTAVTYARRGSVGCLLALVADEDDDAEGAMDRPSFANLAAPATPRQRPREELGLSPRRVGNAATEYAGGAIPTTCPICGNGVWDNRAKKAAGEYKATYPDWSCKDKDCKTEGRRTGGYVSTVMAAAAGPGLDDVPPPDEEY